MWLFVSTQEMWLLAVESLHLGEYYGMPIDISRFLFWFVPTTDYHSHLLCCSGCNQERLYNQIREADIWDGMWVEAQKYYSHPANTIIRPRMIPFHGARMMFNVHWLGSAVYKGWNDQASEIWLYIDTLPALRKISKSAMINTCRCANINPPAGADSGWPKLQDITISFTSSYRSSNPLPQSAFS